jgi:N-acetylneuraminate synthase
MPREIILGDLKIGPYHKPAFIAEIGINHNGDPLLARDMAHAAIDSGADIIKFQHHLPEFEMTGNHGWMELMRECQLELETLSWLQQHIEKSGKVFLCTPFCREAADELNEIEVLGFKTGSGELNPTTPAHCPIQ